MASAKTYCWRLRRSCLALSLYLILNLSLLDRALPLPKPLCIRSAWHLRHALVIVVDTIWQSQAQRIQWAFGGGKAPSAKDKYRIRRTYGDK